MVSPEIDNLLLLRWEEACSLFPPLNFAVVTFDYQHSEHFDKERGFATTTFDGSTFHLRLSPKLLSQSSDRCDAILRHEIGHIVDLFQVELPPGLPSTPERRADAIAELVWGQPIFYDSAMVQSLMSGVRPRPEALGL